MGDPARTLRQSFAGLGAGILSPLRTRSESRLVAAPGTAATRVVGAFRQAGHAPGLGLQLLVPLWLTRHFWLDGGLPAGTDMLGFVARAQENSAGLTALQLWSPESLGAVRQITLESALGLGTKLTGNAVTTVELTVYLLLALSGLGAYLLTWSWYRNRVAATTAGLLFVVSQISLSQTTSGHLNVMVAVAAAPFLLWAGSRCLEQFRLLEALILSLVGATVVFARIDMIFYVVPFVALYAVVWAISTGRFRQTAAAATRTVAIAVPSIAFLSFYELLPAAAGVRATWLSGGGLFTTQDFLDRSVSASESLLGFGREIGYLAFTNQQTWYSHPFVPYWAYVGLAAVSVALALSALLHYRDPRTTFLLIGATTSVFLAKGPHGPVSAPYRWGMAHVPVFSNLRDPNRWLIIASLAYAVLIGVTLVHVARGSFRRRGFGNLPQGGARARLLAVCLLGAVLVPVAPTLASGLRIWRPTAAQTALLRVVSHQPRGLVATLPFSQTRRFVRAGSYSGWEHDLGAESALFTRHAALGDGGWDPSASAFVASAAHVLAAGDPAFSRLLAAVGIRSLLAFNYLPTAPDLVSTSNPRFQLRGLTRQDSLRRVVANRAGSVFTVADPTSLVSLRRSAVVLGGESGLAALADMPGTQARDVAALDAADLLRDGGAGSLAHAVRRAPEVLFAGERLSDIVAQATPALVTAPGITSNVDLAHETHTVLSDESTAIGALRDESLAVPRIGNHTVFEFHSPDSGPVEVWIRARHLAAAASLSVAVDGRRVSALTPASSVDSGFTWQRLGLLSLDVGSHRLSVAAAPSVFGDGFEVAAVKLVRPIAREHVARDVAGALGDRAAVTGYAFDVDDALKWQSAEQLFGRPTSVCRGADPCWSALDARGVRSTKAKGGPAAVHIRAEGTQRYHALVEHFMPGPADWRRRSYLVLTYRGTGDGAGYSLLIDQDPSHLDSRALPFVDSRAGWNKRVFSLASLQRSLGHVVSVRIAADDKAIPVDLQIARLDLTQQMQRMPLTLNVEPQRALRDVFLERATSVRPRRIATVPPGRARVTVRVPIAVLGQHYRVVIAAARPPRVATFPAVDATRSGLLGYRVHADVVPRGSFLVFAQALDPHWKLIAGGRVLSPIRAWGAVDAFPLPPGHLDARLRFDGQSAENIGAAVSGAFLLVVLVALCLLFRRRRPRDPFPLAVAGPDSRSRLLVLAIRLLCALPILAAVSAPRAADAVALLVLALAFAAAARVVKQANSRPR